MKWNYDAEKTVILGIMENNKWYWVATEILEYKDFHNVKYANLYKQISKMISENIDVNFINVSEMNVFTAFELSEIMVSISRIPIGTFRTACHIVKDNSVIRHTYELSNKVKLDIENGENVYDVINNTQKEFESLINFNAIDTYLPNQLGEVLYQQYLYMCNNKDKIPKSGFSTFDNYYGGFVPNEYSIIAARTNIGKSAYILSNVNNISKNGQMAAILTTEETEFQILLRLASINTGIDLIKFRQFNLNNKDVHDILYNYCSSLERSNIIIERIKSANELHIYAKLKMLRERYNVSVAFIDLADKIKCSEKKGSRQLEIKTISNKLAEASKNIDGLHVCASVQISRAAETDAFSTPKLHHLKESGDWEQDVDLAILIDRPEKYGHTTFSDKTTSCVGKAKIIIAKGKNVPTGHFLIGFNAPTVHFYDLDTIDYEKQNPTWENPYINHNESEPF